MQQLSLHETQYVRKIGKLPRIWDTGNYFIPGIDWAGEVTDNEDVETFITLLQIYYNSACVYAEFFLF